ncbi:hypothetical protein GCM10010840_01940 [Deinococcus aerolatus]|uniref:Uncharacterized protein n=1 Tax=Deinococcus aerolatus TaxID=522487 RepID=A0ABQ2FZA5_9DEIO|nr:hypothetical protein [Deinococcus aerolatus]GGL67539.1 hypothetical protein GCM10010840_01940 [Deinococcus aerolatus]
MGDFQSEPEGISTEASAFHKPTLIAKFNDFHQGQIGGKLSAFRPGNPQTAFQIQVGAGLQETCLKFIDRPDKQVDAVEFTLKVLGNLKRWQVHGLQGSGRRVDEERARLP